MKPWSLFLALLFMTTSLRTHGQSTTSLDEKLNLAWELRYEHPDSSLLILKQVREYAREKELISIIGKSLNIEGIIKRSTGNYTAAAVLFNESINNYSKISDSLGIAGVWTNLGNLEYMRGRFETALEYLFAASEVYVSYLEKLRLANTYYNIGNAFQKDGDLDNAIKYHRASYYMYLEDNDSTKIAEALYSLSADFLLSKQEDSTFIYANKALTYFEELDFWDGKADVFDILAQLSRDKKKFENSENHYKSAIGLYNKFSTPDDPKLFLLYLNRAGLFIEMRKGTKAINDLWKAKRILSDRDEPEYRLRLARSFTDAFELIGKLDSALIMNKEAFVWYDTLEAKGRTNAIADMREKYETGQKEKRIVQQELENQKTTSQRNISIIISLGIMALSIFGYSYFRQRQKATATIAKQKEKIHEQEVEELLKTQELTAINSMLEGQENERLRIAKDLHDRLGSMLTTIKWSFDSFVEKNTNETEAENMNKASHMLDDAYKEVRRISHDLVSGVLTKFGLVPALEELASTISNGGKLKVKVMSSGLVERLDSTMEITIYRIIQELLSNILKHAKATETIIQLTQLNGELSITVEDNGIGFDMEKIKHGMGIKNVEARAQSLDGNIFFDSGKGNGTTIILEIPMTKNEFS